MSYPAEDRHERDVVGGPARNPSQDVEKHDKSKVLSANPGVPMSGPESGSFHRPQIDQANLKMGKPLQNRAIAPASGALAGMLPGHLAPSLVASSMQGFGAGHPLLASMMRMPQPAFSHVPAGAAAGALAGVTPRNTSLRTPTMPSAVTKPVGLTSQAHGSGGQSQTHAPVTSSSSRPSSPGTSGSHLATVAVATSMHQPGTEHKAGEVRDARPTMMSDLARRGASPTVQSMGAAHPPASVGNKVISIVPSAPLSQSHPVQKPPVVALPSHHPSSAHGSGPASGVGASVSSSMSHMPSAAVGMMSGHSQQSKMLPSNTVSMTQAMLTTTAKVYTPPHHLAFTAPRQPPISSSDSSMNPPDHMRLSKPSGSASPATVSSLHTSTISTVPHLAGPSLNSVVGNEGRMERAHQAIPQFPYHPGMASMAGMAGLFYQDALVHPGLHAQYHQSAFGPMQSLARSQSVATSAAAAAAAQVAAAAAAGVNPMQIMDHPRLIFQPSAAALGVGASGIANLTGTDTPVTAGVMDFSGATAGIYSVPIFNVPQSAGMQAAQLTAPNPNATSPRPSILRKRTSEGLRKPPSQLPFTAEMLVSNQTEAAASPRSDSTLSAPHSTQNSPKPASDSGSQSNEPAAVTTTSVTTSEPPAVSQSAPVSPNKIKREPSSEAAPTSSVATTAVMNGTASSAPATPLLANVTTTSSDAASPRKKPRKQNVVATEDKYGSNVNLEPDSPIDEDKKAKPEEDEDLKFILLKRPKISIVANYKINTNAAHKHFQRYSDVKVKEERKPSIQEIASQKGIVQRANGWRVQHIAGQMDELISAEQEVLKKMGEIREKIPKIKPGQKTKFQDDLVMLNELLQGNIQRSQLVVEQLGDSRKSMVKVLDHRQRVMEIIQKQMNKRNPKKKSQ
ncbi:uncharacterized protein LOC144664466 isoform X2 [Oculina patagonica]